jgi:acetyl-CoA carboxylase biotin carboxyl carrier protein
MTMMSIDEIRRILDMVREHDLVEFELEQDGVKLRVRKDSRHAAAAASGAAEAGVAVSPPAAVAPAPAAPAPATPAAADAGTVEAVELAVVTSPIVGTFYRASAPGAPPFVDVGSVVRKGQVLCIIEAMKLMNEIESEYDGEIVKIYVENGQPVQYGERLFAIRAV